MSTWVSIPNQVVLFGVSPPADRKPIPAETRRQLYRELLERAVSVPGVDGASASFSGLLSSETWRNVVAIEGVARHLTAERCGRSSTR